MRALTGTEVHSPSLATQFFDLFDGNYHPRPHCAISDVVPIDAFRTRAITSYDCLGCPTVRLSSTGTQTQAVEVLVLLGNCVFLCSFLQNDSREL